MTKPKPKPKIPAAKKGAAAAINRAKGQLPPGRSSAYQTPPGGWVDGQLHWNERLPRSMTQPGDPRHPMPRANIPKTIEGPGGIVTQTRPMIGRFMAPEVKKALQELQKKWQHVGDVTVSTDPKGFYLFHLPNGKIVPAPKIYGQMIKKPETA